MYAHTLQENLFVGDTDMLSMHIMSSVYRHSSHAVSIRISEGHSFPNVCRDCISCVDTASFFVYNISSELQTSAHPLAFLFCFCSFDELISRR